MGTMLVYFPTYFGNSCAKYMWIYDNSIEHSWQLHIFDKNITTHYPYRFDSIKAGAGFWLKCEKEKI